MTAQHPEAALGSSLAVLEPVINVERMFCEPNKWSRPKADQSKSGSSLPVPFRKQRLSPKV